MITQKSLHPKLSRRCYGSVSYKTESVSVMGHSWSTARVFYRVRPGTAKLEIFCPISSFWNEVGLVQITDSDKSLVNFLMKMFIYVRSRVSVNAI